jgi:tetratricopeptide (TPR) repeat protein
MAVDIKGYRVFIASPSGLDKEREAFRNTLQEYNDVDALKRGVLFWPIGWEETLGGIGRPQSLINEDVRSCDYFVMVLLDRWGSKPDIEGKGKYSSGTEEELHVALECLEDKKMPMKNIVVFFEAVDERRLSDPGPELTKVLEFKKKLEREKYLLFHTFDDIAGFEKLIRKHLADWVREHESGQGAKMARPRVTPRPEVEGEGIVLGKVPEKEEILPESAVNERINEAWKLADEGRVTEAETKFAELVVTTASPVVLNTYGLFLQRVGRLNQAEVMHKKGIELAEKRGDFRALAKNYGNLGLIYQTRGELGKAEEMHKKSLETNEKIGCLDGMANQYSDLGVIHQKRGELDKAEEMLKKSLEIDEKLGRLEGMAGDYGNLGVIHQKRGELDKAEEMLKKSLEISERVGLQEIMANQYGNLGIIYGTKGELNKAEEMNKKSLEIHKKLGLLEEMADDYSNLGGIYQTRGKLDKAEEMLKKSLEINEKLGRLGGMAGDYGNLGVIYQKRGRSDKAEEMHKKSLEISERVGLQEGMASQYGNLGIVYQTKGELDKAEEMYKTSLEIAEKIGLLEVMASDYRSLGVLYKKRGDLGKAREYWEKARDLYKKIEMANEVKMVEGLIERIKKK